MVNEMDVLSRLIIDDASRKAQGVITNSQRVPPSINDETLCSGAFLEETAGFNKCPVELFFKKATILSLEEFKTEKSIGMGNFIDHDDQILKRIIFRIKKKFFYLIRGRSYPFILFTLILDALSYLQGEGNDFYCRVNMLDKKLLKPCRLNELGRKSHTSLALDEVSLVIVGGVIVYRKDFRMLYDNSLETLFERKRQQIKEVVQECILIQNQKYLL